MNILAKLTAAGAVVLFSSGLALADCVDPDTTASTSDAVKTPEVAKDGSMAPLESEPRANAEQDSADAAQKDGGTMPLSTEEDDGNEDLATSQEDAEAQQEGEQTAAAEAQDEC